MDQEEYFCCKLIKWSKLKVNLSRILDICKCLLTYNLEKDMIVKIYKFHPREFVHFSNSEMNNFSQLSKKDSL